MAFFDLIRHLRAMGVETYSLGGIDMNRTERDAKEKFLEFEKMFPPFYRDLESGLCIPKIAEGWEWCFDPAQCYVLEKLNGTNVKLEIDGEKLTIWARNQKHKGYVEVNLNNPEFKYIIQGVSNTIASRKKRFESKTYYGEVIGEKYQGNPYQMDTHLWVNFEPFRGGVEAYKDYPKTPDFESWKEWILQLTSLFNPNVEAEGVIFLNKQTGQMAKLRKDMFSESYQTKRRKRK